ncbi:MAG: hypothetical protein AAF193_08175, partial [Bacteroidota bacterium]
MKNWFLFLSCFTLALVSCQDPLPEAPYSVRLRVDCEDEEVRDLVHNYYGKEITYTIFNDSTFRVKRSAPTGEYQEWINEDGLRIQDISPNNSIRVELNENWLGVYLSDPILSKIERTNMSKEILGRNAIGYIGQNDAGDTTLIWVDEDIPNAWITLKDVPGLPLGYEYYVRGKKVTYMAEAITETQLGFSLDQWEKETVALTPDFYLGVQESEDLYLSGNGVILDIVYYDMTTKEAIDGIFEQTTSAIGGTEKARFYISGGVGKVLLQPGKSYSLLFNRQDCVPKRVAINLTDLPEDGGLYQLQMDVGTFPSSNMELMEYLFQVPVANWSYDPISGEMVYDEAYSFEVNKEVERIRVG